ncbi:MAG: ABC transporter permease, partial [Candidatus Acidiferrales bacterium]
MKNRHKLWGALILLAGLHGLVLFAGFFAPYGSATQDRELPFAPPTRIHFVDARGKFHARPFVYGLKDDPKAPGSFAVDSAQVYSLHFFVQGSSYKAAGLFHSNVHLFGVSAPGRIFVLGSDDYGRDQFTRFLYGGQ